MREACLECQKIKRRSTSKKKKSIWRGDSFSEEFQRSLGPFHGERDQCLPWSVDRDPAKMSSGLFGPTGLFWVLLLSPKRLRRLQLPWYYTGQNIFQVLMNLDLTNTLSKKRERINVTWYAFPWHDPGLLGNYESDEEDGEDLLKERPFLVLGAPTMQSTFVHVQGFVMFQCSRQ